MIDNHKSLSNVLQIPTIDSSSDEGHKPDQLVGQITFEDVHFSYPSRKEVPVCILFDKFCCFVFFVFYDRSVENDKVKTVDLNNYLMKCAVILHLLSHTHNYTVFAFIEAVVKEQDLSFFLICKCMCFSSI